MLTTITCYKRKSCPTRWFSTSDFPLRILTSSATTRFMKYLPGVFEILPNFQLLSGIGLSPRKFLHCFLDLVILQEISIFPILIDSCLRYLDSAKRTWAETDKCILNLTILTNRRRWLTLTIRSLILSRYSPSQFTPKIRNNSLKRLKETNHFYNIQGGRGISTNFL